jgi:hypothetical protein
MIVGLWHVLLSVRIFFTPKLGIIIIIIIIITILQHHTDML